MISIRNIRTIATYERRILSRSWFFRIFAILVLVVAGFYSGITMLEHSGFSWTQRSLPTALIYSVLSLFNVGQAIIALFLASDFMKRDKKLDTAEVLFIRPMSNADYVIGKTLGIVSLFVFLNLVVLALAATFQLASGAVPLKVLPMLYYMLLLTLPSLLFILGLSFSMMSLLKNQALTFLVLLGYVALVMFYLGEKQMYLFDYMAYQLPMPYSDIVGFSHFDALLTHRLAYAFAGLGLISLSVVLLKRLPQVRFSILISSTFTVVMLLASAWLFTSYVNRNNTRIENRAQWVEQASDYYNYPALNVSQMNIDFEMGKEARASVKMEIQNSGNRSADTLIFSLNPGLKVEKAAVNQREVSVSQEGMIVKLFGMGTVLPGQRVNVDMSYSGQFDFDVSYLDASTETFFDSKAAGVFNVAYEYGFYSPKYVLLTSENLWYPVSGVPYDPSRPAVFRQQFSKYSLTVRCPKGMIPVSQGSRSSTDSLVFNFTNRDPLPQISLAISSYQEKKLATGNLNLTLAHQYGHDFYSKHLNELGDTMLVLINDFLDNYERPLSLYYPYPEFSLVEVPLQFASLTHSWTSTMAQSQPQMVLFPEWGFGQNQVDFQSNIFQQQRRQRWSNEELTEKQKQASAFNMFLSRTFSNESVELSFQQRRNNETAPPNPFNIFSNYYYYVNFITSDECPVLNYAFESYLRTGSSADMGNLFRRMGNSISDTDKANLILNGKSLEQIITTESDKLVVNNVLKAKGSYLLTWIEKQIGDTDFDTFLRNYLYDNSYREITYAELSQQIQQRFNTSIEGFIGQWYREKEIPAYAWTEPKLEQGVKDDQTVYTLRMQISNHGKAHGLVKLSIQLGEGGGGGRGGFGGGFGGGGFGGGFGGGQANQPLERTYLIAAGESREIQIILDEQPRMLTVDTQVSKNIPALRTVFGLNVSKDKPARLDDYSIVIDKTITFDTPGELIVDNDDPGFSTIDPSLNNPIRKMFEKEKSTNREFTSVDAFQEAPAAWSLTASNDYYGEFERTAMVIRPGEGNKVATWVQPITESGYYDVYVYLVRQRRGFGGRGPGGAGGPGARGGNNEVEGSYFYTVYHDDGVDEIEMQAADFESGWNLIGSFYISGNEAKVVLSDKGGAQQVIADAVKWIKQR
jgi:ABC-type transport system involved in multi-copper enzyme maturation permease subunit